MPRPRRKADRPSATAPKPTSPQLSIAERLRRLTVLAASKSTLEYSDYLACGLGNTRYQGIDG